MTTEQLIELLFAGTITLAQLSELSRADLTSIPTETVEKMWDKASMYLGTSRNLEQNVSSYLI